MSARKSRRESSASTKGLGEEVAELESDARALKTRLMDEVRTENPDMTDEQLEEGWKAAAAILGL